MAAVKTKPARVHLPRVPRGMGRRFVRCKTRGCGRVYFYDYIPYSLSNPILTIACGHSVGLRFYEMVREISEAEFHQLRLAEIARDKAKAKPGGGCG